ncbi:MAG: HAMP domain-containing sensor histidine kinase [Bacteroidia bacterium]
MKLNNYEIKGIIKVILLVFAFLIGFFSLWYTNTLVNKLESQEREKIATWANATQLITSPEAEGNLNFLYEIIQANTTIPVILTDSNGVVNQFRNIEAFKMKNEAWVVDKIAEMKKQNEPFEIEFVGGKQFIYYENSTLLNQLRIYPYFQLAVIALFLAMSYFAFSYSRTSEQNKVWAGMSKETAHQLGTPISSLMAWLDYLKESDAVVPQKVITEMEHDMDRLGLITERFSKIGSEPSLTICSLYEVIEESVRYINSRTSDKVSIFIRDQEKFKEAQVQINKPLFAWVVENLCKNAVDAMEGKGEIVFSFQGIRDTKVLIDISDSGKGVPSNKFKTIFKPGYTTKKRGWGLGLSLVKRIVENYHKGKIYVKSSELDKGTVFRIEINQVA